MRYLSFTLVLIITLLSQTISANEQASKKEQCAQYGAYQDEDGNWQTCSEEDMPPEDDS